MSLKILSKLVGNFEANKLQGELVFASDGIGTSVYGSKNGGESII